MKSFTDQLYHINDDTNKSFTLDLFRYQYNHNEIYNLYCKHIGISSDSISQIEDIPFLPISFFKTQAVKTGKWTENHQFKSSGTTGRNTSVHYIKNLNAYFFHAKMIFESYYGNISDYVILALLPSYLEREGSSLVAMLDYFIKCTGNLASGFYLHNHEELIRLLNALKKQDKKIMLWGVTFALIELAEQYSIDLNNVIIMETGGMKGRREELTRQQVHAFLGEKFNVARIHSEYGMTELLSQAYAGNQGRFICSHWLKVFLRDINDPLSIDNNQKQGAINIIDLANIYSCAFIATDDLGRINEDGTFEILGRLDNSDIRGCNLLLN